MQQSRQIVGFHVTVPVMRIAPLDVNMEVLPLPEGEWSPDVHGYGQEVLDFLTVSDIHLVHVNQDEDSVQNHTYVGLVMYQGIPRMVVTMVPSAFFESGIPMSTQQLFGETCIWVLAARIDLQE